MRILKMNNNNIKIISLSHFIICISFCVYPCYASDQYHRFDGINSSTDRNHYPNSMVCMDIKPQHSVDIGQITGMWYGNEIIIHTQDVPGIYQYDSCVIIHLTDITSQMHIGNRQFNQKLYDRQEDHDSFDDESTVRYLRLVWSEKDNNLEYTFNFMSSKPGLWTNIGNQRGSLAATNQYTQFSGTVQVVKAVNDHLVLTFCGNEMRSSIYTVVLSRTEKGLSVEELRSIRSLLSRRGLYTETIRKVCSSTAAHAALLSFTTIIIIELFLHFKIVLNNIGCSL